MITLGIETSCDETAIGIVKDDQVLANIVSSQIVHSKFGGVVPELAARNHIKIIIPLVKLALEVAAKSLTEIDLVGATRGPGLIGAILVGLSFAKSLAMALHKPFIGVNHLEGHIHSLYLGKSKPQFPYLVLLVSGGHTELILVKKEFDYETIGKTLDDACGEAFDKVAKLLGLPYPGGPYIEESAKKGRRGAIKFPLPKPGGFNFSYAGLKTAVLYYLRDHHNFNREDVAANFQEVAIEHLIQVTKRGIELTKVRYLGVVGGVSANNRLQKKFANFASELGVKLLIPDLQFCTDNGAMIALVSARRYKKFGPSALTTDAVAREPLEAIAN